MDLPGSVDEDARDSALTTSPQAVESSNMYPDEADDLGSAHGSWDETCDGKCDGPDCICCISCTSSEPSGGPDPPPVRTKWEPFLTLFVLFPKLPVEIQTLIWHHTLRPRTVEVQYDTRKGFYTCNRTPVALRVCPESREAVVKLYPRSFGSLMHKPSIVYNSSIDTLYFHSSMQPRITQFLSLSAIELERIQHIAFDSDIDDFDMLGSGLFPSEDSAMISFKLASHAMLGLKHVLLVENLERWEDEGIPSGNGEMILFESLPYELQVFMWKTGLHVHFNQDFSEFIRCSGVHDSILGGFKAEIVASIYGWRPTELPAITPFWHNSY